nr:MAG: hypothetical protein [Microvirus sp.]
MEKDLTDAFRSQRDFAHARLLIPTFSLAVFDYCFYFGGSVTSWLRSQRRNRLVGGVDHSFHIYGLAADVVLDDFSMSTVADREAFAAALGLKLIFEGSHDHLMLL